MEKINNFVKKHFYTIILGIFIFNVFLFFNTIRINKQVKENKTEIITINKNVSSLVNEVKDNSNYTVIIKTMEQNKKIDTINNKLNFLVTKNDLSKLENNIHANVNINTNKIITVNNKNTLKIIDNINNNK